MPVVALLVAGGAMGAASSEALGGSDEDREPRTRPAPGPRRVALVGDSLLVGAEDQIIAALPPGSDTRFDGENGRRIAERLDAAAASAATEPDALVVVLGANDLNARSTPQIERDIAALLDSVENVPCVRWVTVQEDFYLPGMEDAEARARAVNLTLYREARGRENLGVADFATVINSQPTWHQMDLLHLDDRGNRALARVIADSLDC